MEMTRGLLCLHLDSGLNKRSPLRIYNHELGVWYYSIVVYLCVALKRSDPLLPVFLNAFRVVPLPIILNFHDVVLSTFSFMVPSTWFCSCVLYNEQARSFYTTLCAGTSDSSSLALLGSCRLSICLSSSQILTISLVWCGLLFSFLVFVHTYIFL